MNGDTVSLGVAQAGTEATCKAARLQPRVEILHALVMILMRLYSFYPNNNEIVIFSCPWEGDYIGYIWDCSVIYPGFQPNVLQTPQEGPSAPLPLTHRGTQSHSVTKQSGLFC